MTRVKEKLSMYRDDLLRARAAAVRLSYGDIVEQTGVSRPTVGKIMNGDPSGKFELRNLQIIAARLGVSMSDLFVPSEAKQEAQAA
jgi:transcriptional regulator with XRE-family HTH domain